MGLKNRYDTSSEYLRSVKKKKKIFSITFYSFILPPDKGYFRK